MRWVTHIKEGNIFKNFTVQFFLFLGKKLVMAYFLFFYYPFYPPSWPIWFFYLQAKLFKILREVDQAIKNSCTTKEERQRHPHIDIHNFGHRLLSSFFTLYRDREKSGGGGLLVCELLFEKSLKEAYEIEHGYGSMDWIWMEEWMNLNVFIFCLDEFITH